MGIMSIAEVTKNMTYELYCCTSFLKHKIIYSWIGYAKILTEMRCNKMKVDIWSDFVCPFGDIGKRRFEKALKTLNKDDHITIKYKSYQLDPCAKKNPEKSIHELLASKYGMGVEKAKATNADIGKQAAEEGLKYHFDTMIHTNTFDAHRVAKYAEANEKGKEMTERLLKAYFTDTRHIADHATLVELAEEVGLNSKEVAALLGENDFASLVRAEERQAREIGVKGVPFFVFNDKYAVSGAQPTEVFLDVLEKVWIDENKKPFLHDLNPKDLETSYCTGEGCKVEENK